MNASQANDRRHSMKHYRQGDVFVRQVAEIPANTREVKDKRGIVLAEGEVTGHFHRIDSPDAVLHATTEEVERRFLEVLTDNGVDLTHDEHSTITLPRGLYEVTIQREWAGTEIVRVAD